MNKELVKNVIAHRAIKNELQRQSYLLTVQVIDEVEPLSDCHFWDVLSAVTDTVKIDVRNDKYVSNIFSAVVQEVDNTEELFGFVRKYQELVSAVHNSDSCYNLVKDYGYYSDDGWNDFADFLPLRGERTYHDVVCCDTEIVDADYHKEHLSDTQEKYVASYFIETVQGWTDDLLDDSDAVDIIYDNVESGVGGFVKSVVV
jgi:hypothetical protein